MKLYEILLCTTDSAPSRRITHTFGLVRGSSVRARHLGKDITAAFKNLVGGEIDDYTKLMAEARALGADAVVGLRFSGTEITAGAAEFLAYGTAVKLAPGE